MNKQPIQLSPPYFDQGLSQEILVSNPELVINDFERQVAEYVGRKHAVALNSGTSAIHLAVKVLGIGDGDIMLCQSMTYAATAFPILYVGAEPIFVDSEADTWNMDPELLEKSIRELIAKDLRPKAIATVDLYGMPAKMKKLEEIAAEYEIPIIEDAAEAFGATDDGKPCGSFGKVSILSFNSNKVMTSGGGGMLLTDDEELAEKARYFAAQSKDPGPEMHHQEVGYNYRMNHINASLGLQQFQKLEERLTHRRKVYDFYKAHLGDIHAVSFMDEPANACPSRWLSTLLIDRYASKGIGWKEVMNALAAENIESRPLWKPMHLQPVFKDTPAYVNGVSEKLYEQGICLPSGFHLTEEDLERVVEVVRKVLG